MKKDSKIDASILRQRAEKFMANMANTASPDEADMLKFIHELHVHQIELEMQNKELKLAQAKLLEAAAGKYAKLYDFSPSGYLTLSRFGEIYELNLCAAQIIGKERTSLINSRLGFFVSDDTKPLFNSFLDNIFLNNTRETCEVKILANGNLPIYVHLSGIVSENENECLIAMLDICEVKQVAELNQVLLSSLTYPAMYIRRYDRVIIAANKIALDLGVKIGGHCWREFMKEEFISQQNKNISAKFSTTVPAKFDIKCSFCLGDECFLETPEQNNLEVNAFGSIWNTYWIKVSGDVFLHYAVNITERKMAEEALFESEARFRNLLQDVENVSVQGYGPDGTTQYWNKASEDLYGYTAREAIGRNLVDLIIPPEMRDFVTQAIQQMANTGVAIPASELLLMRKDGTRVPVFSSHTIIHVPGRPQELFCIDIDLTERKNAEIQLNKYASELSKLNTDKDRFISILAHDLKNPFNSILGFLGLLVDNIHKYDIDKIEKQVNIINNSAQHFYNLLKDILMWAQSQSGKLTFEPHKLNLSDICTDILLDLKLLADIKNISITHIATKDITVFADRDMLKTILRNLISNAIKFTNPKGQVDIYASQTGLSTTITVSDTGIGISPEIIAKLFDISQIHTTKGTANESGTGLGLFLCKEFVENHGGTIRVESQPGIGSKVIFTLPISK